MLLDGIVLSEEEMTEHEAVPQFPVDLDVCVCVCVCVELSGVFRRYNLDFKLEWM
jgi:hypothetical protein